MAELSHTLLRDEVERCFKVNMLWMLARSSAVSWCSWRERITLYSWEWGSLMQKLSTRWLFPIFSTCITPPKNLYILSTAATKLKRWFLLAILSWRLSHTFIVLTSNLFTSFKTSLASREKSCVLWQLHLSVLY